MSDSEHVSLRTQGDASVLIELLDRRRRPIASSVGELETDVKPGLYVVAVGTGADRTERMIAVQEGQGFADHALSWTLRTVAPVLGTALSHEFHVHGAMVSSRDVHARLGNGARIVVFVRHLDEAAAYGSPALAAHLPIESLQLHRGEAGGSRFGLGNVAQRDTQAGWAASSVEVDPGGYVLRWHEPRGMGPSRWRSQERVIDQALFVPPGWTLLVYVGHAPGQGLMRPRTSLHMTRLGVGLEPGEQEVHQSQVALESALAGLRTGTGAVNTTQLNQLLRGKFENPVLGLVGLHVLLRRPRHSRDLWDSVMERMRDLVGADHPDLVALHVMHDGPDAALPPVTHPPMFSSGYRALIAADADTPHQLPSGSLGERCAARLRPEGPWTTWVPEDERLAPEQEDHAMQRAEQTAADLGAFRALQDEADDAPNVLGPAPARVLGAPPTSPDLASPEVQMVARALQMLPLQEPDLVETLQLADLARIAGLPVASARRALGRLLLFRMSRPPG